MSVCLGVMLLLAAIWGVPSFRDCGWMSAAEPRSADGKPYV